MACEDYPCCGHELGDCEGRKYGSDESIKEYAMAHASCDHENGVYECMSDEDYDEAEDFVDEEECLIHGKVTVLESTPRPGFVGTIYVLQLSCGCEGVDASGDTLNEV